MKHQFRGIVALLVVTLVWGTTFPTMKGLTAHFSPVVIIMLRFGVAALVLLPFLWRATRADCRSGALLGLVLFISYVFQVEGLALTSSNRNAFITGLNVLVVPLLGYLAGHKPGRHMVVALLLAVGGLFALCADGDASWGNGETLALLGAFFCGLYVRMMETATRQASRLMTLTVMQIATVAVCAALWLVLGGAGFGESGVGAAAVREHADKFIYLGVVCTAAIISLQTWGQRHSSANEAAVIYAFEPGAAAFFAYFWLGEVMTWQGWLGAALLISGMIMSQWNASRPAGALVPE
ncbi:DMT family transporter [Janthinobacterium agaricidamnosum]|uniref:EamA domain-containing protein n=1 Tax=Janthinobacterium agaricidamnosum NBRC 102515 = DSM 9628 TaxID=1349767 RepID=W0UZD4_9BURK|nr:DMT family transporter [Janthinobacterium agaricidamnosum]CDG80966.1 conserved hypothetical protein [Janthinobacterium agaricidamnosum NBRC 102515 = DSM 9628]